ncbi:unnamed protein product [Periconia digitata]|uniref:DUF6594 domain-containing protein n=1 Tax=Periconia digitata TaxID=1303443 RepID=A0A9W4USM8_9PLEO|nr:unnamed protein product [Periconia digitata]
MQTPTRLRGIPTLSTFIGSDTDALIFRKFSVLAARNLLHLQSRINELESQLDDLDASDVEAAKSNPHVSDCARAYDELQDAAAQFREGKVVEGEEEAMRKFYENAHERVRLHGEISSALHRYRKALLDEHRIQTLPSPSSTALSTFKRILRPAKQTPLLTGYDGKIADRTSDLVALGQPGEDDRLSRFLRYTCGYCLRDRKLTASRSSSPEAKIYYYPPRRVQMLSYSVSVIFCGILLVGAMACLGAIERRSWKLRIAMVSVFTGLFAVVVGLLSGARRAEVFGATAAYAAVLVVFVGSNVGVGNGG